MAVSSLARRVATALVLLAAVLAALFALPPAGWALAVLAVVLLAAFEWSQLCEGRGLVAAGFVGAVAMAGFALLLVAPPQPGRGFADVIVYASCGLAAAFWLLVAPGWLRHATRARGLAAKRAAGFVVLVATWVALVELQAHSPWLVLGAMAVVWIADTAAYFAGRAFGRRKLAPAISPGKTWEGVWGALAAVALYAIVLAALVPRSGVVVPDVAATALFVAAAMLLAGISVVGDLFESLLKRQAGVKDSGALLPGHGGVLDRVDALLAAMPVAALAVTAWSAAT